MSEKIEIEFKFRIGDTVKSDTIAELGGTKTGSIISRRWTEVITDFGQESFHYQVAHGIGWSWLGESKLSLAEPPLTIKEVLEMCKKLPCGKDWQKLPDGPLRQVFLDHESKSEVIE